MTDLPDPDAEPTNREPWEPVTLPPDAHTQEGVDAIYDALRQLGMIKPGEGVMRMHKWNCPAAHPPHADAECTCPGGAELIFSDWDEQHPARHAFTPERFYD